MDTYCEYIIKRKKGPKEALTIAGIIIGAIILSLILPSLISMVPVISFFSPLVWVGIIWFAYKLISSKNIEFEYTLTGSDLDIDKILNRSSRKKVISVAKSEIGVVAPLGSSNLPPLNNVQIIDATSNRPDANIYVMTVNKENMQAIYFEPTEKILSNLKERNPRKVFTD